MATREKSTRADQKNSSMLIIAYRMQRKQMHFGSSQKKRQFISITVADKLPFFEYKLC
jgi:hypothetical protein